MALNAGQIWPSMQVKYGAQCRSNMRILAAKKVIKCVFHTCLIIPMFRCSYPLCIRCAWLLYILHVNNVEIQVGLDYIQVGETEASCYNFL